MSVLLKSAANKGLVSVATEIFPNFLKEARIDDDEEEERYVFGMIFNQFECPPRYPEFIKSLKKEILVRTKSAKKSMGQGIFRVCGSVDKHRKAVSDIEKSKGENCDDILESLDVFEMCGLLKGFYRDLSPPVFPRSLLLKNDFLSKEFRNPKKKGKATDLELTEKGVTELKIIIESLEPARRYFLEDIVRYLNDVSKFSKKTKMDLNNLAIVFAPNIISEIDDDERREKRDFTLLSETILSLNVFSVIVMKYLEWFPNSNFQ